MRRKSERVKDKSTDRKSEKSPKKSRRSSRRRKKSSSTSPEESETDEYETSFKSAKDDTEEEHSSSSRHGKSRTSHAETNSDTSALAVEVEEKELPTVVGGRTRRHSKKQSADEVEEKQIVTEHESEMKTEKEEVESVAETPEKHKDSDSKSSVWQVKSADCGGGEIKKLKLCIVRPPEPTEPAPRKRKKLSRMSHKDSELADEVDDHTSHDSLDEKRKSRKSDRSVTDDSNSESYKPARSPERKPKAEVSSGDEQREEKCVQGKESVDEEKEQDDKESSIDENTTGDSSECKEKSTDPFDELTKETRVPEKLQEQSNSPLEKSIHVDSSISQSTTPTVATSPVQLDNIQTETAQTRPSENQLEENPSVSAESNLTENTTKFPPKGDNVSSEETNASSCPEIKPSAEKEPEYSSTVQENVKDQNHEETITAADSPKENIKVCNSDPEMLENKVNIPERISKSRNSSVDKRDDSPTHKSAENAKSPNSSENDLPISKLSTKVVKSQDSSPKKSKRHHSSDGSSKGDDSEEERSNHRKQHVGKKRVIQLNRTSSDSRHKTSEKDKEKEEHPSISDPSRGSKARLDEPHEQQSLSKHSNKLKSVSKENKVKSISEDTSRPERRKYKTFGSQESAVESFTDKPPVREKISLKRSTCYAIYPTSTPSIAEAEIKVDNEGKPDNGEHPDQSSTIEEKVSAVTDVPNLTRKRRWRANQAISTAPKKPTLSISSVSLKHLIPEAKPLAISEVQLTEEEDEEEEGEVVSEKVREPIDKDIDVDINKIKDEVLSSKLTEEQKIYPSPMVPDPPESNTGSVRKISLMSSDAARLQRSPSPPRHRISNVLFVTNLVRPFTVNQLRELLARTGQIQKDGFWIDKIKSKCYVQYETDTEAQETRHALHGVRWPVSNPKQLCVDFAKKEDMDLAPVLSEGNHNNIPRKTEPLKIDRIDNWLTDQGRDKDRERAMKEEREREKLRVKEKNALGPMDILEKSRAAKMAMSVREWDLGKMDPGHFDDRGFHREERSRERERERRMRKERSIRSSSRELPARKMRKKEEDAPAKLLDDLFKKTKVTPCVYWLPLTADQIVVKEEMRRKHMAEHERRMAEMRKAERDRQRTRMQGRSSQRRLDDREREKRKHHSLSGSPKK